MYIISIENSKQLLKTIKIFYSRQITYIIILWLTFLNHTYNKKKNLYTIRINIFFFNSFYALFHTVTQHYNE